MTQNVPGQGSSGDEGFSAGTPDGPRSARGNRTDLSRPSSLRLHRKGWIVAAFTVGVVGITAGVAGAATFDRHTTPVVGLDATSPDPQDEMPKVIDDITPTVPDLDDEMPKVIDDISGPCRAIDTIRHPVRPGAALTTGVTISGCPARPSATSQVKVNILNSHRGDLSIDVIDPDGTRYPLKAADRRDRATDVYEGYTVDLSRVKARSANGTWTLRVVNTAERDTAELSFWTLDLRA